MSKLFSSKGKRAKPSPDYGKLTVKVIVGLVVVVILLMNIFSYLVSVVSYYGDGMEPALESGQMLIIRRTQDVEPGDIIAFYYNNKVLVRRVICTGGSQISIGDDGSVSINGQVLPEPYVTEPTRGQCSISFPFSVPHGTVFVMGDNRGIAMDSRLSAIGTISEDRIIGKVILTF